MRKTLCNSKWEMAATRLTKKCQLGRHDFQHTCRYDGRDVFGMHSISCSDWCVSLILWALSTCMRARCEA